MAWADFPALVAGTSPMKLSHFTDIRAALIERCEWIGDSTQKTNATNLSTTNPFNVTWLNSARAICEAIADDFFKGAGIHSGSTHSGWSDSVLKQWLYDNLSGEASGIGKSGSTYNWINRPTRIGTLVLGSTMPAATYSSWLEHLKGLYNYIDNLRWIRIYQEWASSSIKNARKRGGYFSTQAAAWASMKAATPGFTVTGDTIAPQIFRWTDGGGGNPYRYQDIRQLNQHGFQTAPLAAISEWDAVDFICKVGSGGYKGPFKAMTGVTNSAVGCYTTGSVLKASFTLAAANTYEAFAADNPDNLPKSEPWYDLFYDLAYDGSAVSASQLSNGIQNGTWIAKPATIYGS